jgi:asparagine synthase (glutamine-hydrolysing)
MSAAVIHRGPDGEGFWTSPPDERGFGVLLAHRRLSILDLTTAASQPMTDVVSGDVLIFNGEIYNFQELRQQLVAAGHSFRSTGDTEVLLRMLSTHGEAALEQLRGMFALALWRADRRELLLARDPLGIKPLYLARNPDPRGTWSLAFASEVRPLLASGLLGRAKLHPDAPASIAWNGFIVGPPTVVEGIESLGPGVCQTFNAVGVAGPALEYWGVRPRPRAGAIEEDELAHELQRCVSLHLESDVPLAVFLSGGIDSSVVANLAQRAVSPIHTFTLAFEEQEFNEGPVARRIAAAIGSEHREVVLSEGNFVRQLDDALDSLDQPTFDGLNAYFMSHAVREAGFKVALVGTGGDELFGGYTSFRDLPAMHRWSKRLSFLPRAPLLAAAHMISKLMQRADRNFPPQTRWAKLPDMVSHGCDLLSLYQLAYALFLPACQRELVHVDAAWERVSIPVDGLPSAHREKLERETQGRPPLSALSVMEQRLFLGERLLRDNDAASMAASIEQRLPLVDHVLFEAVDRLPEATRYQPLRKKAALRRIGLRGLDPSLFNRRKAGFVLPFDRWIRRGLQKSVDQALRDHEAVRQAGFAPAPVERLWRAFLAGAPGVYWSRVWAIYVHVRWCHHHGIHR